MFNTNKELISQLRQQGVQSKILKAIEKIDRANFIPPELQSQAYEDIPLSISYGQTISQPYTVAFMLQALELNPGNKVLEIGTGSGWNAALISFLIGEQGKLYTIERVAELAEIARERLSVYQNIKVISGNALKLSKKYAPYDRIILTAAPSQIPEIFKQQLAESGILLAPIGQQAGLFSSQQMIKITKHKAKYAQQNLGDFVFVPLIEK